MTNKISFRAKTLENSEWKIGFYYIDDIGEHRHMLKPPALKPVEIDPDTLCAYTGVCDRDHKMIFEHDIVMNGYRVKWNLLGYWELDDDKDWPLYKYADHRRFRIEGNIFDEPEILKNDIP